MRKPSRSTLTCFGLVLTSLLMTSAAQGQFLPSLPTPGPPKPYDAITRPPARDSRPDLNIAGRAGYRLPDLAKHRKKSPTLPTTLPGGGDSGFFILNGDTVTAVYSGHDVRTDVSLDSSADLTLYAPTMSVPQPNGAIGCLETVTVHWRYPSQGMTDTAHAQGFWDHCVTHGWVAFKFLTDPDVRNAYVRSFDGSDRLFTAVQADWSGTWHGLLYNFNSGQWEEQASVSSTNLPCCWTGGWTMFETHGFEESGSCPVLPPIRSAPVEIYSANTGWIYLQQPYSSRFEYGTCFGAGSYSFDTVTPDSDWMVCGGGGSCL
jgi:hypothetical protein